MIKGKDEIRCVVPSGDICGEGAVWQPDESALYWTDINRFLVHRLKPVTQAVNTWFFDEPVTSVNLTTSPDRLLLVFGSKVGLWSPGTHPHVETITQLQCAPAMRYNDARIDPLGSLWVGTMRNNVGPGGEDLDVKFGDGVLYRIDPDRTESEWKDGVGISNTLAWSPDQRAFYFGDSSTNIINRYDYDPVTGAISGERPFFVAYKGALDGSVIDSESFLWNTRPGAGCLVRIAPNGQVDRVVSLPVSKPTTCTFGGNDLKTLYITSARSDEQFSGSVFALETDVGGLPEGRFRLL
jgi:sugar lactone lactonase YvrE